MVNYYTINRISKNLYIVRCGNDIVKECSSYREAQNYMLTAQTNELMGVTNKAV